MKKNLVFRFISLVLTSVMILGLLPALGVVAADETIGAIDKAQDTFRLAVVSDAHLGATATAPYNNLTKALDYFDTIGGVDALAMNGDMVYAPAVANVSSNKYVYNGTEVAIPAGLYNGLKNALEANGNYTLAGTQDGDVFTADISSGKKPIIYAMGNHGYAENDSDATRSAASKQLFAEATGRNSRHIMNVGGYTFVMGDAKDFFNDYKDSEEFVKNAILAAEAADTSNKPIFLLQHEPVFGTVENSDSAPNWNTQAFKDFLNEHPRVIVLSAHTHVAEDDPRTIWQDGFTAMSTAQLGGGSIASDGATYAMGSSTSGSQCMMIDLTTKTNATDVKVYRINVLTGKMIGDPYTFTIDGTKNSTFRYGKANVTDDIISKASYATDTSLEVTKEAREGFTFNLKSNAVVTGGSADYLQDDFVHSYKVIVKNNDANCIVQNFRVMGDFFMADKKSSFSVKIPKQLGRNTNYTISVYALTPFMADYSVAELEASGIIPATYTFTTSAEMTDADKALTSTGTMNVAAGKKVIAGNPNHSASTAAMMVNGSHSDVIHAAANASDGSYTQGTVILPSGATINSATHQKNDWFIVDLGRRYDISEVKLWPRGDTTYNNIFMQYVDIEASNVEDFSSYVKLGGIGSAPADAGVTGKTTPFVTEGDGNAYRYIRVRRTGNSAYGYSELEVFADVELFEVSRNKTVQSNYPSSGSYAASNITDGLTNDSNDFWYVNAWYNNSSNPIPYVVVDLETDVPVSLIQMYARRTIVSGANPHTNWEAYGFTNAQSDIVNADSFNPTQGTKLLAPASGDFPLNLSSNDPNNYYEKGVGGASYRYVAFRKTYYNVQLAEVKIFTEITDKEPVVTSVVNEGGKVVVSFSEKMDASTITEDNFTFSDNSAVISAPSLSEGWDGGYDVTFTVTGAQPVGTLTVSSDVKSANRIPLSSDKVLQLGYQKIDINKSYSKKLEDVNVAFNKPVYSGHASADGSKLTNGVFQEMLSVSSSSYPASAPQITVPSGDKLTGATGYGTDWYIVDLQNRYNIKQIKLFAPGSNYGYIERWVTNFDIEGSNSITFENSVRLGGIGSDADIAGVTGSNTPYVINLDGESAYRYIRIKRTGANDYGYGEIEVYADVMTTEVSRGAKVTLDSGYTNSFGSADGIKAQLTNGNTSYEYGGVLFEGIASSMAAPYNILVDLGKTYPIGMIEMWGRGNEKGNFAGTTTYRRYWTVYGSTAENAPTSAQDTSKAVKLLSIGSTAYPASGLKGAITAGDYRYLTFSKTAKEIGCVGEIRASVINPMLLGAKINNDNTVTVTFSDRLDSTTISADDFSITGVEITDMSIETIEWDDAYEVTLTYDGEIKNGAVLTASETIRSQSGIEMAADGIYTFDFVTNKILKAGDALAESLATNTVYTFTANYNGNAAVSGKVYIVLKKDVAIGEEDTAETVVVGNTSAFESNTSGIAALTATLDTTNIDVSGCWIEVYVWDNNLCPQMTGAYIFGK